MSATRIRRHVNAPRASVYRALLAREGGALRVSLSYDEPTGAGKTSAHTDTYNGRFVKLVPNEQVVEVDESKRKIPRCAAR